MDGINVKKILDRENIAENMCKILRDFELNKTNLLDIWFSKKSMQIRKMLNKSNRNFTIIIAFINSKVAI